MVHVSFWEYFDKMCACGRHLFSEAKINQALLVLESRGALHYAKDSGNFGQNSNGKVSFGFFLPEYSGSSLEMVHIFQSENSDRNLPFHF